MYFEIGLEEGPEGFAKPILENDAAAAHGALYLAEKCSRFDQKLSKPV